MRSNLILTGGINHDFIDTAEALAEVLLEAGFESTITDDMHAGFDQLANSRFDLITIFTLRWRMLDDDKYIPYRDEWSYEINERDRTNLVSHMAKGGGLLGLHTACICFDTWQEWSDLLGAKWVWQQTFHPLPAALQVRVGAQHSICQGLTDFEVVDELYHDLWTGPDSVPLLSAVSSDNGTQQTIAVANEVFGGRSVFSSLGHDRASMETEGHARFIQNAADWCVSG